MWKRVLLLTALAGGFFLAGNSEASAARWRRGVVYRRPVVVAPVRRVVHRAVGVATYPILPRVVARPVIRTYAYPVYPYYYEPGISVHVGF